MDVRLRRGDLLHRLPDRDGAAMTAHLIALATLAAATWAMTGAAGWLDRRAGR